MLKRLHVDNYKVLRSLDLNLSRCNLLAGRNGTGKSAIFEVLDRLRRTINEVEPVHEVFPQVTLSAEHEDARQRFGLRVELDGGREIFEYRLEIEHDLTSSLPRARILEEALDACDSSGRARPLFRFEAGEVRLFRDDHSEGPSFPLDWTRSGLATVPERVENSRLQRFRRWLEGVWTVRLELAQMDELAKAETHRPAPGFHDFVAWLRHAMNERPDTYAAFGDALEQAIDGFISLSLAQRGEGGRVLRVRFGDPSVEVSFGQLSDGQRALIALYSLLHYGESISLLCLDEPDNYLALREIQPLIYELCEAADETGPQLLVVSHHPELLSHLAFDNKLLLRRADHKTSVAPLVAAPGLSVAETVARGWEDD